MKRILIVIGLLGFITGCQSTSSFDKNLNDAHKMNEIIELDGTIITVTEVVTSLIDQSIHHDEVIIRVYMNFTGEPPFTSNTLRGLLETDQTISAYMVDGLDYLVGKTQAEAPFVRFSVPKGSKTMLLFLSDTICVHLVWT